MKENCDSVGELSCLFNGVIELNRGANSFGDGVGYDWERARLVAAA